VESANCIESNIEEKSLVQPIILFQYGKLKRMRKKILGKSDQSKDIEH
jgi:hypothetical protein